MNTLLGALRESKAAWNGAPPASLALYPQIVQGVFDNVYQPRSYSAIPGRYPLPWLDIGVRDAYTASPPGDDYANYATGVAVFMRYALQAYDADPALLAPYRALVVGAANGVVQSGFGANACPAGGCDAFAAAGGSPEDQMTPYVNSLSVLLLAIRMTR